MRRKIIFLSMLALVLTWTASLSAQVTIQGKVTDKQTNPIIGAVVIVPGTTYGSSTNAQGEYSFEVKKLPANANSVEVKFVGYKTKRETLPSQTGKVTLDFTLEEDILLLDQVVITGNAEAVEKKSLGNSISTLQSKELENIGTAQIDAALTGKIPGAMVQVNSGNPGGGTSVRLRGLSTLYSGTSDPLYIVDGVIVDNSASALIDMGGNATNRIADFDPEDIERIEVVKGAAAAALYGSRANNGVVQIFTKRGQSGQMKVRLNTTYGFDQVVKKLDMITYPYTKTSKDAPLTPVTRYDYQDEIFQIAPRATTSLSLSGGDQTTKYFLSGSWNNQEGIIKSQRYDKKSFRVNIDRIFNDWLSASVSTNYIHSLNNIVANGGAYDNGFGVLTAVTNLPNTYNSYPDANGIYPLAGFNPANRANPLDIINNWKSPEEINRFVGGLKLDATPLQGLSIQYRLGFDGYSQNDKYYIPRISSQTMYPNGFSQDATKQSQSINSNIDVTYNTSLTSKIKSTSAVGTEYFQMESDLVSSQTQDLTPFVELLNGSAAYDAVSESKDVRKTLGYYFQETLNYDNLLYLTGSLRADASSTFGADQRWQIFPKYSASYIVSENDFWKENLANYISYFKVRGAFGFSGGQPASSFGRLSNYTQVSYNGKLGLINSLILGNDNLKPERMKEWELGTDFELLNGRIGLEFTYFNKKVEDLIMQAPVDASTGFTSQFQNVGILSNKGIELLLRTVNFQMPSFNWSSTISVSTNNPIVDKLYAGKQVVISWYQTVLEEGKAPSTFYTYKIDYNKLDANGLPTRKTYKEYLGDPNPKLMWSFTNDFTLWSNLSMRVMFDAQWDFKVLDWNSRNLKSASYPNSPDFAKEYTGELPWGYNVRVNSALGEFVSDASFVKLREVSISYTLRNEAIRSVGLNNIQVSLTGRNLFTFTNYSGYDPETNAAGQSAYIRGFDFATCPIPRSIIFGLTLNL
ncbi:MAG: SusC/RagA family TonB-linked outer membrane protein [Ignavibacteria bacterium]|jgi:TonB-linked SusC/RagA family outer membrane protein|nr:SusC/RagA family TonB-linked outer membrane protein [Ignavibacteria bacterium]MCU7502518.1 SusC/RagA family TonB-linked outer membrane protein [Ignavibacteria bacterium]MCU7515279.1 SusC/RagA family TonB-linked outer membrane protein [Ignavibacteria bacterium]